MGKPHVHVELIKAWADGEDIEFFDDIDQEWLYLPFPHWDANTKYRVKPALGSKINTFYTGTYRGEEVILVHFDMDNFRAMYPNGSVGWLSKNNLELTLKEELK